MDPIRAKRVLAVPIAPIAGCVALVMAGTPRPAGAITVVYRPVLTSGQAAPGLPGETLNVASLSPTPSPAVIDSAGRFVALAVRQPGGRAVIIAGDSRAHPSTLRIVASAGDPAPGHPAGVTIQAFRPRFSITAQGSAIFGVSTTNTEAWIAEPAPGQALRTLMRTGQAIPALGGAEVASLNAFEQSPRANAAGDIAFTVLTNNGWAMFRAVAGNAAAPVLVAAEGQPVPGEGVGVEYTTVPTHLLVMDSGEVFAPVSIAGESAMGAYLPGSTVPRFLLRRGDVVDGATLENFTSTVACNHGSGPIAMFTTISSGGGGVAYVAGRADAPGPPGFRAFAVSGQTAPQVGSSMVYGTLSPAIIALSAEGRAAYAAEVRQNSPGAIADSVVYTEGPGGPGAPTLVLREDAQAPGLLSGVRIRRIERTGSWPTDIAINTRRQTLVSAGLVGTGVTAANDYAIWAVDPGGTVQLIMREGSPLSIAPGDTRTVAVIHQRRLGGAAPSSNWFNDAGEFIVDVSFTDSSRMLLVGTLDPRCPGDFNGIDGVTVQDVFDFLAAWFALVPAADVDGSGGVSLQDLFDFLVSYFTPCS